MKPSLIIRSLIVSGLIAYVPVVAASATSFDARNAAMGHTGSASSRFGAAPLFNPALLAKPGNNNISLIAPSLGAQASDPGHLVDRFDDVKNRWDKLENAIAGTHPADIATAAGELKNVVSDIAGNQADANVSLSMVLAVPSDSTPVSLFISSWGKGTAQALVSESDLEYLEGVESGRLPPPTKGDLDALTSRAEGMVALVTEYGVSIAHPFTLGNVQMGFGFSPKIQRIETWNYNVAINNYDSSDLRDGNWQRQAISGNIDAGIYADLMPNWTLALSGQNLIEQRFKSREVNGSQNAFVIRPQITAGSAWVQGPVTLTADIDLSPVSGFATVDKRQYAAVGAELAATSWAQVRAGYRVDMRGNDHRAFTAGFGLTPSDRVQFDLAAMAGRMRNIGGVAQFSFAF